MTVNSLWGEIENPPTEKLPIVILKEQSQELKEITKGLLEGHISQSTIKDGLLLSFSINAPTLNNYRYSVLEVSHGIVDVYPLGVRSSSESWGKNKCNTVEEFKSKLKEIFSTPEVKRVISGLLAQIQAA